MKNVADEKQRQLMQEWLDHTGFEFMGHDQVRAGDPQGFIDLWNKNVQWLHDVADECAAMIDEYARQN